MSSDLSGAEWLASASPFPRSVSALWSARPQVPLPLPCGSVFDVISAPPLFGRRMLDVMWATGPGSGPVARDRGRVLFFAEPGTARRLPALLGWEEWQARRTAGTAGRAEPIPPLLAYGPGDLVSVPAPPQPGEPGDEEGGWLVSPGPGRPWLPGPDALLRAAVRTVRAGREPGRGPSISGHRVAGAKVYDVSRRR
ncbi:hypothetical protein V1J52_08200 [Streptomyces sp. TRM 70351]|uniref:hypothetical protein n=1 Tax=Streptomyces sp. TRM 70351 TaxID=3116552 RepID=UPI002E7B270D|nr:hypothetical protein [Streptomyces sp. TRM 70351]MEE1928174.1 hypothetical protein [Streptomyces sp. TRM 70351]